MERSLASLMRRGGYTSTSIVIQETIRCWLPDRSAEAGKKKKMKDTKRGFGHLISSLVKVEFSEFVTGAKIMPVFSRAKRINTG